MIAHQIVDRRDPPKGSSDFFVRVPDDATISFDIYFDRHGIVA